MDLNDLAHQAHRDSRQWFPANAADLKHHVLGLAGEAGEVANIVKKLDRGDMTLEDVRKDLAEEATDVLIYALNIFAIIGVDPIAMWDIKRAKNMLRFEKSSEHVKIAVGDQVVLIDADDRELVGEHSWHLLKVPGVHRTRYYAAATTWVDGKPGSILMHNLIMGAKGIDHIDGNGLNNTRTNLRVATASQNQGNSQKTARKTSSKYKGVAWYKNYGKWRVALARQFLGYFTSEEDAAKAYDAAAREKWGEFAALNFPNPGEKNALEGVGNGTAD
jgi:NTP pyrophosphatase (non-canonical NTP hydrolase)